MTLQRDSENTMVWGYGKPGTDVTTTYKGTRKFSTTVGADGSWRQKFGTNNTPAGGPFTIDIAASTGETINLVDVLFGDVYVCGGCVGGKLPYASMHGLRVCVCVTLPKAALRHRGRLSRVTEAPKVSTLSEETYVYIATITPQRTTTHSQAEQHAIHSRLRLQRHG